MMEETIIALQSGTLSVEYGYGFMNDGAYGVWVSFYSPEETRHEFVGFGILNLTGH